MGDKLCYRCKLWKPLEEFYVKSSTKDGRQGHCKECQKLYNKKHYKDNKAKYLARAIDHNAKYIAKFKDWKSQFKCKTCGEDDIACLDFHHKDEDTKIANIADAVRNKWSLDKVKEEALKCEILCANCHRKYHYYRLEANG